MVEVFKHVKVSKEIHKKIKKKAAEEERAIQEIINDILQKEFD